MPPNPQWLLRLPQIVEELAALDRPVLDRATIERVFRLKRRRAIELMHRFQGYQAGRTFLLDRLQLLGQLQRLLESPEFLGEVHRKERLTEALEKIRKQRRAARVELPVAADVLKRKMRDLPPGINLRPGLLEVDFQTPEELLAKLFELAQAISNDYEAFQEFVRDS
jgi:hypothetical protein